jgi:DNA-binding NarL/FixJ family response regulator
VLAAWSRYGSRRGVLVSINIFLIDDQMIVLEGLRALLETHLQLKVVGMATNSQNALTQVRVTRPHVVVSEFSLLVDDSARGDDSKGNDLPTGVNTMRQLALECPNAKIVVLSMNTSTDYIAQALQAGASGYVAKNAGSRELIDAIFSVASGRRYLSRDLSLALSDAYISDQIAGNPLHILSPRERQVLQLVVQGTPSSAIAQLLGLSVSTVDTYRSRLKVKLGVDNTVDLVKFAIRNQLTAVD